MIQYTKGVYKYLPEDQSSTRQHGQSIGTFHNQCLGGGGGGWIVDNKKVGQVDLCHFHEFDMLAVLPVSDNTKIIFKIKVV